MPTKLFNGELWPHTPLIKTTRTHRNMSLELAFYPPSGVSLSHKIICYEGTIEPMQSQFRLGPIVVDAPFGVYEVCYRKNYSQISQRCPIRIGMQVDGIGYYPTSGEGVSATQTEETGNRNELVIPAAVSINGKEHKVTEIEAEAFMMNNFLSVIDLPSSIEKINYNAFATCPSLYQIILRSEQPPFSYRNHIAPGLRKSAEFYVPATAYDAYKPLLEKYNHVYTLVETIQSKDTAISDLSSTVSLDVYPAHEAINPNFIITPADDASASMAEIKSVSVENGSLNLEIKAKQSGNAIFHIRPAHRLEDYAVLSLNITLKDDPSTGISSITGDTPYSTDHNVYTVSGIRVNSDISNLPAGVYIVNGRKVVVR